MYLTSVAGLLALLSDGAGAADFPSAVKTPATDTWNPWLLRVRAIYVLPEDGGLVNGVPFSDLSYSDMVVPELDISYFIDKNFAVETIVGTTAHTIYGQGSLAGLDVGEVWILPFTVTIQYHFDGFGKFKPYVGAGPNYTVFYNQSEHNVAGLDVKNAWGFALQAGFDLMIDQHWGINVDVKKVFVKPNFDVVVGGSHLTGTADLNPWLIGTGVSYRF
ncbi:MULTISPECIES: OmpW/AlkL family protein [Xanthobacter]|uniref:OmpW/AlkL family protein n=1 Tax=Xanthobacter TaxID=279 RepID=UPI0024A7910A|nr:OmpW family outer membrane protein [Xanthobacter autotrophicus]MDI4655151.1 outer membrane beta-barrel protein [Xanthobacter autotrophicus]MDI4665674.1 outer membrane beta-barrel protein [Xanthobacter autotrophicus]